MNIPDVVGFTLGAAKKFLVEADIEIACIDITAPPKGRPSTYDDSFRVIRLKVVREKQVELLVCSAYYNG